ncbi:MAG: hypothetical protein JO127_17170 [Caulobacteraceae bacterium]|nr:hypothetical protein [Caulobacteraceae bacterium]
MVYVEDPRYSTPHFFVAKADDDEAARRLAQAQLAASDHYRSVDVFEDDRRVCAFAKTADGAPVEREA